MSRLRTLVCGLAVAAFVVAGSILGPAATAQAALGHDDLVAATLATRMASADAYAATRPGTVGIVVLDRTTGALVANRYADTPVWTASTIKLAMATDLLRRARANTITLSAADRADLHAMLHSSDDGAADRLWFAYSGADHRTFNRDFAAFGMTALAPQRGFSSVYPYWGFQKDTPRDLARLVDFVLTRPAAADRARLVAEMRGVAPDQQWGIRSLPGALAPGNKDGWSDEQGGSVINTIGFAGTGARFVIAIMNSLNGQGGQAAGRVTVTRVAGLLMT